jgi:hypothetical protein
VNRRRLLQLWRDKGLVEHIRYQARRHFFRLEDREDAVDEAWEKITALTGHPSRDEIKKRALNAINNLYDREHRRRARLVHSDGNKISSPIYDDGNG